MARAIDSAFLQLDVELHTTPRFLAFASALRLHLPEHEVGAWVSVAYLALIRTWERFLKHQSDGRPTGCPADVLEEWAGWRGTRGEFAAAFAAHWVVRDSEGPVLRGWHERYGKLARKRAQDAERKRLARRAAPSLFDDGAEPDEDDDGNVHWTSAGYPTGSPTDVRTPVHRTSDGKASENDTRVKSKEKQPLLPSPDGEGPAPDADEAPFVLDDDEPVAVMAPPPAPRRAAASATPAKPRKGPEPKYPHFHAETRKALLDIWEREVRPLKHGEPGRLFATFGPFFRDPESERPASAPRDAEVLAAVREILQARSHGGRATAALSVPEYCAERVYPVVEILRETTNPHDRVRQVDRLLGINSVVQKAGR
jgi:hypothetical protein